MEKSKTTSCKVCNAEIAKSAKICPSCGAKNKKPLYQRVWFWLIIIVVVMSIGGLGSGGTAEDPAEISSAEQTDAEVDAASQAVDEEASPVPAPSAPSEPAATMGQRNALNKAYDYLDYTAFSYSGLITQLEYEGFTNADAVYAVDRCGADWNEQAAKKAAEYMDYDSFSRDGLITQLEYEGFSREQAIYGVGAVGY